MDVDVMLALHGVEGVVCLPILDDLISGYHVACYMHWRERRVCGMRWNGTSLDGGGSHIWLF